jgi:hypothetical protein
VIVAGPVNVTVTEGESAILFVAASAVPPPAYQWQRNGLPIAGAVDPAYTTPVTTLADDGSRFRCVVTNEGGGAVSGEAVVTVLSGETAFVRGDSNGAGGVDIADAIFILSWLFAQGPTPTCMKAADANDTGSADIGDAVWILSFLFASAPAPAEPFIACGQDPTDDALTCETYVPCE